LFFFSNLYNRTHNQLGYGLTLSSLGCVSVDLLVCTSRTQRSEYEPGGQFAQKGTGGQDPETDVQSPEYTNEDTDNLVA
jgi:hypothetical protein